MSSVSSAIFLLRKRPWNLTNIFITNSSDLPNLQTKYYFQNLSMNSSNLPKFRFFYLYGLPLFCTVYAQGIWTVCLIFSSPEHFRRTTRLINNTLLQYRVIRTSNLNFAYIFTYRRTICTKNSSVAYVLGYTILQECVTYTVPTEFVCCESYKNVQLLGGKKAILKPPTRKQHIFKMYEWDCPNSYECQN